LSIAFGDPALRIVEIATRQKGSGCAMWAQATEEEVRESSPASSIQLDLSGVNDSGAAAFDEVIILDSSSNGAPSEADAAPEHLGLQPDDDVAMGALSLLML
jgi:hypothetical protein